MAVQGLPFSQALGMAAVYTAATVLAFFAGQQGWNTIAYPFAMGAGYLALFGIMGGFRPKPEP